MNVSCSHLSKTSIIKASKKVLSATSKSSSSSNLDPMNLLTTAATAPRNRNSAKTSNPPPTPTATLGPGAKNEYGDQPQPPKNGTP